MGWVCFGIAVVFLLLALVQLGVQAGAIFDLKEGDNAQCKKWVSRCLALDQKRVQLQIELAEYTDELHETRQQRDKAEDEAERYRQALSTINQTLIDTEGVGYSFDDVVDSYAFRADGK